ncbi:cysteine desulfurase family protein [Patescibacteria group bacterium]
MKKTYLDYAATSPVDPQVVKAMLPYWTLDYGNPSSPHSWGSKARSALKKSRNLVAKFLNCKSDEVIFTSCATEANNLSLKGAVESWQQVNKGKTPHIIVSSIEHHCVLDAALHLQKQGVKVTFVKVDKSGLVNPKEVEKILSKNTVLVSIIFGNNEIGTIQPIAEIGLMLKKYKDKNNYPLFHTDAVQAVQYLDLNVNRLHVDLLSASAHKFYGPKGVGFLYIKKGTSITKQQDGGSQEFAKRAGTENTAGIVGLAKALELVLKHKSMEVKRLTTLRDYLIKKLLFSIPDIQLTGHAKKRLPHIASFVVPGAEGEAMLLHLDDKSIAATSGSACSSGELKPSHVLLSLGIKPEVAHGSLRFSLGKYTTLKDIDNLIKVLPNIVRNLRIMNPLYKLNKYKK